MIMLDETKDIVVKKRGGGERIIKKGKWYINKSTEIGEDASIWERKPYGGYRYIDRKEIIKQL